MRSIDADALKKAIKTECNPYGKPIIDFESGKRVLKIIDNAPTIEALTWIPIETRDPDPEESEALCKIYGEPDADEMPIFFGPMPDDGQEILISTIYGGVYFDICSVDCEEGLNIFALENGGDWEGVTAWMPMPKPYKEEES